MFGITWIIKKPLRDEFERLLKYYNSKKSWTWYLVPIGRLLCLQQKTCFFYLNKINQVNNKGLPLDAHTWDIFNLKFMHLKKKGSVSMACYTFSRCLSDSLFDPAGAGRNASLTAGVRHWPTPEERKCGGVEGHQPLSDGCWWVWETNYISASWHCLTALMMSVQRYRLHAGFLFGWVVL